MNKRAGKGGASKPAGATAGVSDLKPKSDNVVRGGAPNVSEIVVTKPTDG